MILGLAARIGFAGCSPRTSRATIHWGLYMACRASGRWQCLHKRDPVTKHCAVSHHVQDSMGPCQGSATSRKGTWPSKSAPSMRPARLQFAFCFPLYSHTSPTQTLSSPCRIPCYPCFAFPRGVWERHRCRAPAKRLLYPAAPSTRSRSAPGMLMSHEQSAIQAI